MADIAAIFHWSPDALGAMSPGALARWRAQARRRAETKAPGRG